MLYDGLVLVVAMGRYQLVMGVEWIGKGLMVNVFWRIRIVQLLLPWMVEVGNDLVNGGKRD